MSCSKKCTSTAKLDGKTAIVTGSNTGIGKETVQDFYQRGARVIMACRSTEKAQAAVVDIKKNCDGKENLGEIVVYELDLSSLKSVRKCASEILSKEERIDILLNNAGIMMCPLTRTEEGYELQFATNHLGHFLLTMLLIPKICQSTPARIVNVSSLLHTRGGRINFDDINWEKRPYSPSDAYQQSKLANIMFTKELAKRLEEANIQGVNVYSLHPGVINTDLNRHLDDSFIKGTEWIIKNFGAWFMKTPKQGAQTSIYCCVDEKCAKETGLYYSECAPKKPSKNAEHVEDNERLWVKSLKLVGLPEDYNPFNLKENLNIG